MFGMVDLHGRAGAETGAAIHALGRVHQQRCPTVYHGRPDRGHGTAGDDFRQLAGVGEDLMVDPRRPGMLDDNGDIGLAAAVDGAAGSGNAHLGRQAPVDEIVVEIVHHRFHHPGGIGGGNIAVQPALGVRHVGNARADAADRQADSLKRPDHRFNIFLFSCHQFDIVAHRESKITVCISVGYIAYLPNQIDGILPRRPGPDRVQYVTAGGRVFQHSRLRYLMGFPGAVIFSDHGMKGLAVIIRT